jgi:small-conductance mechanosensitive channel
MKYLLNFYHLGYGKAILVIGITLCILGITYIIRSKIAVRVTNIARRYLLRKLAYGIAIFLILLTLIFAYTESLASIAVVLGVVGAGVAFALQEVIVSVAGWLAVIFGGFYSVGDRVQLGGIKGDVIDIGVLRTTLMELGQWVDGDLYNGRIVRVANSFVFKEPVFNYSSDFPFLWDEIKFPIHYGGDYALARKIIYSAAKKLSGNYPTEAVSYFNAMTSKYMIENAQLEPMVSMTANDNWVEFTLRYVVNYKGRRVMKDALFTEILEALKKQSRHLQIASTTLELVPAPKFAKRKTISKRQKRSPT